jgi:exopolysaccharide biosynthesis WecB/TagA/CpsF family protein
MSPEAEVLAADPRLFRAAEGTSLFWRAGPDRAPAVELFGLRFANLSIATAVADMLAAARARIATQVVFVNAHVVNVMATDPAYADTVARSDVRLVDGSGMAIAARLAGQRFTANTNGTDLFPQLCAAAARSGQRIFLLGGAHGIAERAAATIGAAGHGTVIAGTQHGYLIPGSREEDEAIARINRARPDVLLVGLGVPLQDLWIARNRHRLDVPVLAGVGGLFDFFAGAAPRAPHALRAIGMEWAWRLAQEPGRLWRRYLIGNVTFLARAAAWAVRQRLGLSRPARSGAARATG